jgi:hypothetical protein
VVIGYQLLVIRVVALGVVKFGCKIRSKRKWGDFLLIRFIRLMRVDIQPLYKVNKFPLPWADKYQPSSTLINPHQQKNAKRYHPDN